MLQKSARAPVQSADRHTRNKKLYLSWQGVEGSTGEPVQSADRHTSKSKLAKLGRVGKCKKVRVHLSSLRTDTPEKRNYCCLIGQGVKKEVQVNLSSLRTDTQVPVSTNNLDQKMKVKKCECTCPVCGQTHPKQKTVP